MKYKFSIVDTESDLLIGYCSKIDGLIGKIVEESGYFYHKIILFDFIFCDEYKEYLKEKKERFSGGTINILDNYMKTMAHFGFGTSRYIKHTQFYELKSHINFELIGKLYDIATENELKLWDKWKENFPKEKNEWVSLDHSGRRDWLKMLRITMCCGYKKVIENHNTIFYLDGKNITTYDSFFIAFAEAMNGPGTYFGGCLGGFDDCLCGGFGVKPGFKLIWENSSVAAEHLNEDEWKKESLYRKERDKKLLEYDEEEYDYNSNLNIFHAIIQTLLDRGVEVVLKP